MDESYIEKEVVYYPNGGKSIFYVSQDIVIIIDDNICDLNGSKEIFPYSMITDKQNSYMFQYKQVFRFLKEDQEDIDKYIKQLRNWEEIEFKRAVVNREDCADASPLEFLFEKCFVNVYGIGALKFLHKEYGISDDKGNQYFLDYFIQKTNGGVAVEENGIHYHHPQIIGKDRYRRQLNKQNACVAWGIKLYRFSTEDCLYLDRIEDDIQKFFGKDINAFKENSLLADRGVVLYEHQKVTLHDIKKQREKGIKSFLAVFPTASGKSRIVEEDMRIYATEHPSFKALILAPNKSIINDWETRINKSLPQYQHAITIRTYAYMVRNYRDIPSDYFSYIVVDEAHHAVAPMLKRVIQYFDPDFMIGLTATDQRPDKKRLESVFGTYKTRLTLIEAMKKNIIAKANVYRIETNIDLTKVRFNGKDYVNADLEKNIRVNSRNELIADVLKTYFSEGKAAKRQGIIFCVNTKHASEMEKLLNEAGLSAHAYTGITKNADNIMAKFKSKQIRFLCACNMISEGWDYPELGILVMARPTMSKVLYLQQIGRGLRRCENKDNVFIIDVVDEYGALAKPCTMHSIFKNSMYVPFGDITSKNYREGDIIEVDGLQERIERIVEIDIENFEDKYGDYFNQEQLAREFYVSTDTINSWIKKGKIKPSASFAFGSRKIYLFSLDDVKEIRDRLQIPEHNDETIKKDFFDFLNERDYSLSYKMPFLLSFIKYMDRMGDARIEDVLTNYIDFYKNRIKQNLPVDRSTCPYNESTLSDRKFIKKNMLTNPFEKFERKRFLYYSKDLGVISMNHALLEKLNADDFETIKKQMNEDLHNYYSKII